MGAIGTWKPYEQRFRRSQRGSAEREQLLWAEKIRQTFLNSSCCSNGYSTATSVASGSARPPSPARRLSEPAKRHRWRRCCALLFLFMVGWFANPVVEANREE